jgi:hypothetical protein
MIDASRRRQMSGDDGFRAGRRHPLRLARGQPGQEERRDELASLGLHDGAAGVGGSAAAVAGAGDDGQAGLGVDVAASLRRGGLDLVLADAVSAASIPGGADY